MALTPPPVAPPAAPPLPGEAPSRANPSTFRELADAFVVWQVGFRDWLAGLITWLAGYISWASTNVTEMDALQTDVQGNSDAATTAASAAAASAAEVQANRTALDNRLYPGTYSADPVTRPDGSAVQAGDRYFNTSIARQKTYSGTVWATDNLDSAALAGSGGSALVGTIQTGAASVARTLKAKAGDILSPQDKGALADGAANDAAALTALATAGGFVVAPGGSYKSTATVNVKALLANVNAGFTSNQAFGYSVQSVADIAGGVWETTGGVVFNFAAGSRQSIRGALVNNTSPANSTGINVAASVSSTRLIGNDVDVDGYALLTNASAATVSGLVAIGNILDAEKSDAIEINAPGVVHSSIALLGNVLRAGLTGTSLNSGFAVGIARGRGIATVGNTVKESRKAAFHFEDEQHTNLLVGNAALQVSGPGVEFGQWPTGLGEGVVVAANSLRAAAGSAAAGVNAVFDVNGSVPGVTATGNRLVSFAQGILAGLEDIIATGNVIESASDSAINSAGGGSVHGTNLARNCATLGKTSRGAFIGKIVSATTPTTLLDTSGHTAGRIGSVLRGFNHPIGTTPLGAAATTQINLFALPLIMKGRLIVVTVSSGAAFAYASADVLYDGTTLTFTNFIKKAAGVLDVNSTTGLNISGGFMRIGVFNSGAATDCTLKVDFEGEYYK